MRGRLKQGAPPPQLERRERESERETEQRKRDNPQIRRQRQKRIQGKTQGHRPEKGMANEKGHSKRERYKGNGMKRMGQKVRQRERHRRGNQYGCD